MLHAALVLSDHPRARVISIDSSEAGSLPGVQRVFTADDVPGARNHGLIVQRLAAPGGDRRDHSIRRRCARDRRSPTPSTAPERQQRRLRSTTRCSIPSVPRRRRWRPDAPEIHEGAIFSRSAPFRAATSTKRSMLPPMWSRRVSAPSESSTPSSNRKPASRCRADDRLQIFSQGQGVHDDQRQIAAILGIDAATVQVELVSNGGAFGGKEDLSVQGHTALAAWLLQRPVKTVLSREQSLRIHPKRHPLTLHYKAACDAQGRLTAVRARIVGDTGAYASVGAKVLERAAGHSCGPYRVPNVDVEARTVYTNNPPCGAMRGFGANQAAFAIESVLDMLAEKVGIDGYDIRHRNVLDPGDLFATGQLMNSSCGISETLEAVREIYKAAPVAGIACGIKNTGIGNGMEDIGRVAIDVLDGGRLVIRTGYTEMGQGLHTILRQVVAEETSLDLEIMSVLTASDPDVVCGMTTASRATALCTAAGRKAARGLADALEQNNLADLTGRTLQRRVHLRLHDRARRRGGRAHHPHGLRIRDPGGPHGRGRHDRKGRRGARRRPRHQPQSCAGQIEGGVHMGLGYALSEDFPCSKGVPMHLGLRDLGILRAAHTPEIEVILVEVPDGVGGYGSKGVGEIGLVPTAGAVAAALYAFDGKTQDLFTHDRRHCSQSLGPQVAPEISERVRESASRDLPEEHVEVCFDVIAPRPGWHPDLTLIDHHHIPTGLFREERCRIDHEGRPEDQEEVAPGDRLDRTIEVVDRLAEEHDIGFDDAAACAPGHIHLPDHQFHPRQFKLIATLLAVAGPVVAMNGYDAAGPGLLVQ